jgi:hypothetical protein
LTWLVVPETRLPLQLEVFETRRIAAFDHVWEGRLFNCREDFPIANGGCGFGRHVFYTTEFGATIAIGFELFHAVDAALHTVAELPNAHVVQGVIHHPPPPDQNRPGKLGSRIPFSRYALYPFEVSHADWFDRLAAPKTAYFLEDEDWKLIAQLQFDQPKMTFRQGRSLRISAVRPSPSP